MESKKNHGSHVAIFAVVLAFITYYVSMNELKLNLSDYNGHVYTYIPLLKGAQGLDGWMSVPYFMWHLVVILIEGLTPVPLEAAAAFSSCLFAVFGFYVLYWMFERVTLYYKLDCSPLRMAFLAFALCIIQPACMYWFDTAGQYLGQFSMNPMHNPTHMCVKPFSLLCLCFTYDILCKFHDSEHRGVFVNVGGSMRKSYILLAVTLLLSCMAKPTFAEMFIPAVGLFMLFEWLKRLIRKEENAGEYFRKCLTMLLLSVPALAYILIQFLAYFVLGGSYGSNGGGLMLTEWMEVWSLFSENVTASIVLGMGFPLFIVLLNGAYFVKDILGRLGLFGYIVGLLECALLAEGGDKLSHGDFLWPMMSGMTLLWVVATIRLLVLESYQNKNKLQQICIHAAWFVFYVFVIFGVIYIKDYL